MFAEIFEYNLCEKSEFKKKTSYTNTSCCLINDLVYDDSFTDFQCWIVTIVKNTTNQMQMSENVYI